MGFKRYKILTIHQMWCYNCCQSNQRWIKQNITIDTVAKNIVCSEVAMKNNNIKTKVENTVVYIQDVPARIVMFSLLWCCCYICFI